MRISKNRYWILSLLVLILAVLGAGTMLFVQAGQVLTQFEKDRPLPGTILRDKNGAEIKRLGTGSVFVPLDKIPQDLQTAVVDYQDERFYERKGGPITQCLAKIIHTSQGAWARLKLKALPTMLERRYTKKEILEIYLNEAHFGEETRGVEAASQAYFAKPVEKLDLAESALLAALAKESQGVSPYNHPQRALEMRNEALMAMHKHGHLEKRRREEAANTDLNIKKRPHLPGRAHFFADHVSQILTSKFGEGKVLQGGLDVETTLDLKLQTSAEDIFKQHDVQGALVALNPAGEILALVGGRDYGENNKNLAVAKQKNVGFSLRPLINALGLKEGWAMNHMVEDVQRDFNGFRVENAGGRYWGPVTMKHALALNLNAAATWVLDRLGADEFIDFARLVGLQLETENTTLALAMGNIESEGLSLLELTGAYLPFVNEGEFVSPQAIVRATDDQGSEVFIRKNEEAEQVLSKEQAYLLTNMLMAGTEEKFPAAANRSQLTEQTGQWCLGYTPTLLVGVFVEEGGEEEASEIWREFVENTLKEDDEKGEFTVPENIETGILIDVFTGLLANSRCPQVETDAFIKGTAPTQFAPCALAPKTPTQPPTEPLTRPGAPPTPPQEPPVTEPPKPPEVPETTPPPTEPPQPPEIPETGPIPPEESPEPENSNNDTNNSNNSNEDEKQKTRE